MRMKQTSVAMTTDTWPRLDWRVVDAIWGEIVAPGGGKATANGIVASAPAARVAPTACLCVQCGHVSETPNDCPLCGSVAMLNLSRVLDREEI